MLLVALGMLALAQPPAEKTADPPAGTSGKGMVRVLAADGFHSFEIPKNARRRLHGDLLAIHFPEFGEEMVRVSRRAGKDSLSPAMMVRVAAKGLKGELRGKGDSVWMHRAEKEVNGLRMNLWLRATPGGMGMATLNIPETMPEAERKKVVDEIVPALLLTLRKEKGPSKEKAPLLRDDEKNPEVLAVKDDDPEMAACVTEAQATLGEAWRVIERKDKGEPPVFKVRFQEGDRIEFMWVNGIRRRNGVIEGVLQNEPNFLKKVKEGQRVTIKPDDIVDWMYSSDEGTVGAYSVRLLARRMPRERGNEVLEQLGLEPIKD
jgi:uncharacterized protein YegJ (DUF2314 family)